MFSSVLFLATWVTQIVEHKSKLKIKILNRNWKLKLTIEIENWNWKLNLKIEIENWNWKLKLKIEIEIENQNWKLKLKIEIGNKNWKLKIKIEYQDSFAFADVYSLRRIVSTYIINISKLGSTSSTWVLVWYFKYRVLKIGEGTLLWATSCLGPSRFLLNETKINIFHLMHIALFLEVTY